MSYKRDADCEILREPDGRPDLSLTVGDVRLKNPFIVGSGPTTKNISKLREAEESEWAAASLKLAISPTPYINHPPRYRWLKKNNVFAFTAETRLTELESLNLLELAGKVLEELVVIPNIAYEGADEDGWVEVIRRFQNAGARIIELNMCCPNMSFNDTTTGTARTTATGASLGADLNKLRRVVGAVCEVASVPIIVKLTPEGGKISDAAANCIDAGAAAVGSTGNRLGLPEIDILRPRTGLYRLQDENTLACLSGPWVLPLAMRDTYEIRNRLGKNPKVLAAGGVTGLESAVNQIMAGADALWVCTQTIVQGFDWLPGTLTKLQDYLEDLGCTRVQDIRDLFHRTISPASALTIHPGYAVVDSDRCIGCGICMNLGHCNAVSLDDGLARVDTDRCTGCSVCVDLCQRNAITVISTDTNLDERPFQRGLVDL